MDGEYHAFEADARLFRADQIDFVTTSTLRQVKFFNCLKLLHIKFHRPFKTGLEAPKAMKLG